jgi:hypothetical protein
LVFPGGNLQDVFDATDPQSGANEPWQFGRS